VATHRPTSPVRRRKAPNVVSVQPSSLVFLVIIGVWAAYFVQYWVRRREHLATARSVDQFSESMRVLERRSPLPVTDLSVPQPRSYAVSPARAAGPQVLVKRAEPSAAGSPVDSVTSERTSHEAAPADPAASRRMRAMIMLGAMSTVVVAVPLVALSLLPLVTLLVPVVGMGVAVVWSRSTAQAERRARRDGGRTHAPGDAVRGDAARVAAPRRQPGKTESPRETTQPVDGADTWTPATRPHREELYDVQAVDAASAAAATAAPARQSAEMAAPAAVGATDRPLVDEDDIPLTWDPVPVPRPTYTMKARVPRPAPTSADLLGDADTEYTAHEETPVRRVAGA
jgi:hypothetical protein